MTDPREYNWPAVCERAFKFGILVICMACTANNFDHTELTALACMAGGVGGYDILKRLLSQSK